MLKRVSIPGGLPPALDSHRAGARRSVESRPPRRSLVQRPAAASCEEHGASRGRLCGARRSPGRNPDSQAATRRQPVRRRPRRHRTRRPRRRSQRRRTCQAPLQIDRPMALTPSATSALRTARDTASRQMAGGERQAAVDALVRGLALDATDPALNRLADDFALTASRTAADARTAASARGANARSSVEFRGGQTQEREAQQLVRAGERVPGIRAFFAAAALYNNARGPSDQPTPVAPPPTPASPAANAPSPPSPDRPASPPVSSTSPQAPIAGSSATPNTTASVPSPPVATAPPAAATPEPPPIVRRSLTRFPSLRTLGDPRNPSPLRGSVSKPEQRGSRQDHAVAQRRAVARPATRLFELSKLCRGDDATNVSR